MKAGRSVEKQNKNKTLDSIKRIKIKSKIKKMKSRKETSRCQDNSPNKPAPRQRPACEISDKKPLAVFQGKKSKN